jgi:protein phosphatase PTC6
MCPLPAPGICPNRAGAVATVALVHSLDEPRNPFFSSEALHLLVAHLGDTRALLCTAPGGEALVLTERVSPHLPDLRRDYSMRGLTLVRGPVLRCYTGPAFALWQHHPEARSETDRLMRTRTGAVTDSFGEVRPVMLARSAVCSLSAFTVDQLTRIPYDLRPTFLRT